MYLIQARTRQESIELTTQYEYLFDIVWILEHTDSILQFKVSDGDYLPLSSFNWRNFNKWVTKFTYDVHP